MALFRGKFESAKQEWETPTSIFAKLDHEFRFTLDVAADANNAKCPRYFSLEDNGLAQDWKHEVCWMNPPYRQCGKWAQKAYRESLGGALVVCLLPARTNTRWWHEYIMRASEIRFICGRPKFSHAKHGLPQPLAIVIFGKSKPLKVSSFLLPDRTEP